MSTDAALGEYLANDAGIRRQPGIWHAFSYAANNPLRYEDPDGRRVYAAARDLNGVPIGTHQFVVVIPDNPQDFDDARMAELGLPPLRNLGTKESPRMGLVISAHNVDGQLRVKFNEAADFQAAREAFGGADGGLLSDYDPEVSRVSHSAYVSDTSFINGLLTLTKAFQENESNNPIPYPTLAQQGNRPNSNSFAQTLLVLAGALGQKRDFWGWDIGHDIRIPQSHFDETAGSEADGLSGEQVP